MKFGAVGCRTDASIIFGVVASVRDETKVDCQHERSRVVSVEKEMKGTAQMNRGAAF